MNNRHPSEPDGYQIKDAPCGTVFCSSVTPLEVVA
jgi:hypothetical protein